MVIGNTLVATLMSVLGGDALIIPLAAVISRIPLDIISHHAHGIAFATVVISLTLMLLLFGELLPKQLALRRAELLARIVAPLLSTVSVVARPIIWIVGRVSDVVLFAVRPQQDSEPRVSLIDIEHMIETGTEEGVLETVEQRVAMEALRLGERTVRDVMRPRIDLDALDVNTPPEEVIGAVAMAGFSRLPVYEGDLDHIVGFIHIKDLFRQIYLGWQIELRKLLKPALFVPESMPLDRLLELFQEQHNQLAVVLDEYGGTEGMVTLENVIDKLVGEIREGYRQDQENMFVKRDESSWLVDGAYSVADLIQKLDLPSADATEPRPLQHRFGPGIARIGRIPGVGDATQWNGLRLEVVDMDGQRIDRILVTRPAAAAPPAE